MSHVGVDGASSSRGNAASLQDQVKKSSKNDIFSTSWKSQAPPPLPLPITPAVAGHTASLGRSRTTGALLKLRRMRRLGMEDKEQDGTPLVWQGGRVEFEDVVHVGEENATPRAMQLPLCRNTGYKDGEEEWAQCNPQHMCDRESEWPQQSITRTTSFFNMPPTSPSYALDPPTSPSSTSSYSTYSTTLGSNPSLTSLHGYWPEGQVALDSTHVRPNADETLEVRAFQDERFLLGAGRYAKVYLGSYRTRGHGNSPDRAELDSTPVKVCAIKLLETDAESQRLGMREASLLRLLTSEAAKSEHPGRKYLVKLLGIKREFKSATDEERSFSHTRSPSLPTFGTTPLVLSTKELTRRSSLDNFANAYSPSVTSPPPLHLVLSYAPTTLADILRNNPQLLTPNVYLRIGLQLAQALSFLHSQRILHTDLKSHNVLLTADLNVRLADFNTALHLPSLPTPPVDPIGLGTPVYSPPEFNKAPPSPFGYPADVWAFGVVMMVTLVGREPYASLVSGRRSKTGGRSHHELRLWLAKGAYWTWEEQERLEAIESQQAPNCDGGAAAGSSCQNLGVPPFGRDELRRLGVADENLEETLSAVQVQRPTRSTPSSVVEHTADTRPYEDGSPPLFYPGARHIRISQRILTLLKACCSAAAERRPVIHEISTTLKMLQDEV